MVKEESFFISSISEHLSDRQTVSPRDIKWSSLRILADQQQLAPIIYAQCKNKQFEKAYFAAQFYYIKRLEVIRQLDETFRANHLEYFIVKGPVVAQYYPVPALRTMGDVDLVVHQSEREKAADLLSKLGFQLESQGLAEWHLRYQAVSFELHDRLVYDAVNSEERHKIFFNNCWNYVKDNTLDPNFHFIFILWHLRKHFMGFGVGVRQFMDVAMMEQLNLNWTWIEEKLRELNLWSFSQKVFALNSHWFSIEAPIHINPLNEDFYEEATNMILRNGVFGFADRANEMNLVVNLARKEGTGVLNRSKRLLGPIFLSYSNLISMEQYHYLKGKKALLPIAWIHRAIRAVKLGRANKTLKRIVVEAFVSQKKIEARNQLFEKWGL